MHILKLIVLDFWRVVLIWKHRLFEKLYFILDDFFIPTNNNHSLSLLVTDIYSRSLSPPRSLKILASGSLSLCYYYSQLNSWWSQYALIFYYPYLPVLLLLSSNDVLYPRGPQLLGDKPVLVYGLLGTRLHSKSRVVSKWSLTCIKSHSALLALLELETYCTWIIPKPFSPPPTLVFHETSPWCQKGLETTAPSYLSHNLPHCPHPRSLIHLKVKHSTW